MVDTGDSAPDFTAPIATGDVEQFTLSEAVADGPVVLAFFPGAFTSVCTTELCTFTNRLAAFENVDARVVGISRDSPFALNAFREAEGIGFGLVSDLNREIVEAYGVETSFDDLGVHGIAKRSVFVVDEDGTIVYRWVSDDPGVEPDYDAVQAAAAEA